MKIRAYRPEDCSAMASLFYQTVHTINVKDYTPAQLRAWATGQVDLAQWHRSFLEHHTFIAEAECLLLGFGDIDHAGYLDRLYVHADFQRQGIATALCDKMEQACLAPLVTVHASLTARPFFEQRGYLLRYMQQVARHGVLLTNCVMEKRL